MAACHFLLDLMPPFSRGDFAVSSSPGFSLLWSSDSREAEQTYKEDIRTQRVESGQWQGSRSDHLHLLPRQRSPGCHQAMSRLVSVTGSKLWDRTILGAVSTKDDKDGSLVPRNARLVVEKGR